MDEFLDRLAEILDVEILRPEDALRDFPEWDSLSVLSVLAMADAQYGATLRSEDMAQALTAGDLWRLVEARRK
jgi:acyl carrier protein